MLKVVGSETAQDDVDGQSLLDEITREGARRMLVAALETEVAVYLEAHRADRAGYEADRPAAHWTRCQPSSVIPNRHTRSRARRNVGLSRARSSNRAIRYGPCSERRSSKGPAAK